MNKPIPAAAASGGSAGSGLEAAATAALEDCTIRELEANVYGPRNRISSHCSSGLAKASVLLKRITHRACRVAPR